MNQNVTAALFAVANSAGVDVSEICGRCRASDVVAARRAVVFLSRHCFPITASYPEIAAVVSSGRSHTGMLTAYRGFARDARAHDLAREAAVRLGVLDRYLRASYHAGEELPATA